jgi:hypothetical protein
MDEESIMARGLEIQRFSEVNLLELTGYLHQQV